MFFDFFWMELKQRFKSVSTYVFFLMPFLMMFFEVSVRDFGPVGNGKVFVNGPYALAQSFVQLTAFGAILISAIFGPAILRDFQQDTYPLLFTKPISKFDYLGGRWAASFVICALVFSGLVFGGMIGTFMPWADKTRARANPPVDVPAAIFIYYGGADLLSRELVLSASRRFRGGSSWFISRAWCSSRCI